MGLNRSDTLVLLGIAAVVSAAILWVNLAAPIRANSCWLAWPLHATLFVVSVVAGGILTAALFVLYIVSPAS